MSIVKDVYIFKDGRTGILTKSDRVYKATEETVIKEVDGKPIKTTEVKVIFYDVRKKGTGEVYENAVDLYPYDYEEVSFEEMEEKYGSNK